MVAPLARPPGDGAGTGGRLPPVRVRRPGAGGWRRRCRLRLLLVSQAVEVGRGHRVDREQHRVVEGAAQLRALAAEGAAGGSLDVELECSRGPARRRA